MTIIHLFGFLVRLLSCCTDCRMHSVCLSFSVLSCFVMSPTHEPLLRERHVVISCHAVSVHLIFQAIQARTDDSNQILHISIIWILNIHWNYYQNPERRCTKQLLFKVDCTWYG